MAEPLCQAARSPVSGKAVLGLAVLLASGWFFFQGNVGFRPQDEGYLLCNARQTAAGGVPIRDFRSYDPGRYYWIAGCFLLFGNSFFAFRLSLTIVQAVGLLFGLLLIRRIVDQRWLLVLFGMALLLWMFPRYKCFEHALVLGMLFCASWLMEKPDRCRHFLTGIIVGFAALFGKNLGVYFFLGFFSLILFLGRQGDKKKLLRQLAIFIAGVLIGYLPMIGMLLFVPGFFSAFADSVLRLFGPYAPVKYLPIPWPWKVPFAGLPFLDKIRNVLGGTSFVVLFIFYIIGLAYVILSGRSCSRVKSLVTGSLFIGAPLLYHVCGRANYLHLAQGIHPLLIGLVAGIVAARTGKRKFPAVLATLLFLAFTALPVALSGEVKMALQKLKESVFGGSTFVQFEIDRNMVWLPRLQSDSLGMMKAFLAQRMSPGENILIVPYAPGLYCLLNKRSPIWDAYPIHLAPRAEQMQAITDLEDKNVGWALVDLQALDGITEQAFPFTHEWLWKHILREFVAVDCPGTSKTQILFQRRRLTTHKK